MTLHHFGMWQKYNTLKQETKMLPGTATQELKLAYLSPMETHLAH